MVEPIRISVDVAVPPSRAFELFSARLDTWWPREYTWSQDVLEEIGIVEVQFTASAVGTGVTVEHREFGRHGEGASSYREALASPHGWPHILARFRAAAP